MNEHLEDIVIDMRPVLSEAVKATGSRDTRVRTGALSYGSENWGLIRNTGAGSSTSFGMTLRSMLQLGGGYSTEVTDFGDAVSIKVTYTSPRSCKSASQNFLILFYENGQCRAKTNSQRWRTCNDIGQAASYIRSKSTRLQSTASSLD